MNTKISLAAIAIAVAIAGCTTNVVDEAALSITDSTSEDAVTYGTPADVASERFHYGVKNDIWVGGNKPLAHGHFDLLPRGKVDVTLTHEDGRRTVGFKVYRVNPTGSLRLLGEVSARRAVTARIESAAGGTFVIASTGTWPDNRDVALNVLVSCARRDGQCAPAAQPGELCGTRGAKQCDDGLFCDYALNGNDGDMCGATDRGGLCVEKPEVCNRICGQTCGCDGQDHCSACAAHMAGVSVAHEGPCEPVLVVDPPPPADVCDPSVFSKIPDDQLNVFVHGTWRGTGTADGFTIESELGLYDGDYGYEQHWTPTCRNTPSSCRVADRYLWISGGWSHDNATVQLSLDAESQVAPPAELARVFSISQNCEGELRLETIELGETRTFTRDWCAGTQCEDDQHCEVRPVMCIRAPCPPQPVCVDNE